MQLILQDSTCCCFLIQRKCQCQPVTVTSLLYLCVATAQCYTHSSTHLQYTLKYRVFWLCPGEAKLLWDWGELWYCHQLINRPLPTLAWPDSLLLIWLCHIHTVGSGFAGSQGDQNSDKAQCGMTLKCLAKVRVNRDKSNQFRLELQFTEEYRWSCRWPYKHFKLMCWSHGVKTGPTE